MSSPADSNRTTVVGACFCGAVQFEVALPTKMCVHCHCTMCRRNHGAPFVTWFAVDKANFRVTSGESSLTQHKSSEHGRRSFCSRCGTPLFCELDHHPEVIDVTLASMRGPIDLAPQAHIYFDTHVDWLQAFDDLPEWKTP